MIVLSPTTSEQEFNILPRDPNELSSLVLTITEEGTRTSETFSNVTAFENGDWICIAQAFTILTEDRLYEISITQDGSNWYRGKARCTSQTNAADKHSLNAVAESGYYIISDEENFTVIP